MFVEFLAEVYKHPHRHTTDVGQFCLVHGIRIGYGCCLLHRKLAILHKLIYLINCHGLTVDDWKYLRTGGTILVLQLTDHEARWTDLCIEF